MQLLIVGTRLLEKLHYLNLYYHPPDYPRMADKYLVRDLIREKGLGHILNTLYQVVERVDDLDFDALPDSFVLKATHGSGWNIICTDKNQLDWNEARAMLEGWLNDNFYFHTREWVYKHMTPRIVAERYLESPQETGLADYKFYCFNGEPRYIQVTHGRYTSHHLNLYDLNWNLEPFLFAYPNTPYPVQPPSNLSEMLQISRVLSAGHPHMRVDLYDWNERVVFGELTFFPGGMTSEFYPSEYDEIVGRNLILPKL